MVSSKVCLALLLLALAAAGDHDYSNAAMKPADTGLGFTVSVPEFWEKGTPTGNNKFAIGSSEDDFSLVVADFGPAQSDADAARKVYRETFAKNGLTVQTEAEMKIAGRSVTRLILAIDTPSGAGHVEAVMLPVADEMFAVLVITPAASLEQRRAVIEKIFGSIAVGK